MKNEIQVGAVYESITHVGSFVRVFSVENDEVTYEVEDPFGRMTAFVMPAWIFADSFRKVG